MRASAVVAMLVLGVALAGCTSSGVKAKSEAETASTAEAPTVGADSGSVTGLVVDDEERPIARAQIGLLPSDARTTSDAGGRFTLNGVPAGSHTIVVAALGFEDVSKRITVEAGQIVEARFQLRPILVDAPPYVAIYPSVFYMEADFGGFASFLPQIEPLLCNPCNTWQNIAPAPAAVLIEMDWTKSIGAPYVADEHGLLLTANPAANSSTSTTGVGTRVANQYYSPREAYNLTETEVAMLEKVKKTVLRVYSGGSSVSIQQRIYSWMGLAYNGPLPAEFTMLPP